MLKPLYLLWCVLLLAPPVVFAQQLKSTCPKCEEISVMDSMNKAYEFSSLAFRNGQFYFFSEKCSKLFTCSLVPNDKSPLRLTGKGEDTKPMRDTMEIEGIALYKNTFLAADEGKCDRQEKRIVRAKISLYDTQNKSFTPVHVNGLDIDDFVGDHGIEGIAVSKDEKICYLLHERDFNCNVHVYSFKIEDMKSRLTLTFTGDDWHEHFPYGVDTIPDSCHQCRYSDIALGDSNNRLLALLSCYDKSKGAGRYGIIAIPLDGNGIPHGKSESLTDTTGFSGWVNRQKKANKENNIEGMCIKDGYVYIISDNNQIDTCQPDKEGTKPPLMFRWRLSK